MRPPTDRRRRHRRRRHRHRDRLALRAARPAGAPSSTPTRPAARGTPPPACSRRSPNCTTPRPPLLRLSLDSLGRYPAFAAELDRRDRAADRAARSAARSRSPGTAPTSPRCTTCTRSRAALGLDAELLTGRELRELEPALAPGLPGGLLAPGDHQVDPRLLHARSGRGRAPRAGVACVGPTAGVDRGQRDGSPASRWPTAPSCRPATSCSRPGAWSGTVAGVPPRPSPPVRPVKGQTLRLRLPGPPRLDHVVRGDGQGIAGLRRAARRRRARRRRLESRRPASTRAARRRGVRAAARRAVGAARTRRGGARGGQHRAAARLARQRAASSGRPASPG